MMNGLDELRAIAFIRAILHQSAQTSAAGETDPGWCATEHAIVFQIALRALGVEAHIATGNLAYIDLEESRKSFQTLNHNFLVLAGDAPLIFDSSASFRGVEGLPLAWPETYPGLMVMAFDVRTTDDQLAIPAESMHPKIACYLVRHEQGLEPGSLSFISQSPLGLLIEEKFGDQETFWAKVVVMTVRILERKAPTVPLPLEKRYQEALWEWIHSLPDETEYLARRLWGD